MAPRASLLRLLLLATLQHAACGQLGADLTLLSEHVFPAVTDTNRSIAFDAPLRRLMFGECSPPTSSKKNPAQRLVMVVFDAGLGSVALLASNAAATHPAVHIVTTAPHDAPGLAPVIHATLTGAGVNAVLWPTGGQRLSSIPRVLVVQRMEDVALGIAAIVGEAAAGRVAACAIVCDLISSSYRLMSSHIAAVSHLVYSGRVSEVTRVVPSHLQVHVRAASVKDFNRLIAIDPLATEGVDMSRAFPAVPNATFWAAERPAYIGEWGRTVEVAAPFTDGDDDGSFKLSIADIATRLVSNRLPYSTSVTLRVHTAGAAHCLVWWYHLRMDDDVALTGTPARLESPRQPPSGSTLAPPRRLERFGSAVPILPRPLRIAVGDALPVRFIIDSKLVFTMTAATPAPTPAAAPPSLALWHVSMLNDAGRNYVYAEAIRRALAASNSSSRTVLELGAGAGLLAAVAANAGANVVAVEASDDMAQRLRVTVDGLEPAAAARVTVINAPSTAVQVGAAVTATGSIRSPTSIPHRVDVLVHEIFDYSVTGEGVAPSVHDALSRLVRRDRPIIIPARLQVWGVFVRSDELKDRFSLAPFLNPKSSASYLAGAATLPLHMIMHAVNMRSVRHRKVSSPFRVWDVDFTAMPPALYTGAADTLSTIDVTMSNRTRVDALITWFSLGFDQGDDLTYSTGEEDMEFADHWYQAAHMMYVHASSPGKDVYVSAGDAIRVEATVQPYGYGGFPGVRPRMRVIPAAARQKGPVVE